MPSKRFFCVWLPLIASAAYLLGMAALPEPPKCISTLVLSELGVIEIGTAVLFLLAAIMGAVLFIRSRRIAPTRYRAVYIILVLGGLFIAGEETNYGQFIYDFHTGEWFTKQPPVEFNLHKLYGHKPARRLNTVATFGFPVVCIVLPIMGGRYRWYRRGRWGYFLLPGKELIAVTAMAQLLTWLDDIYLAFTSDFNAWARASEFKELYWGYIVLMYSLILLRRLKADFKAAECGEPPH